MNSQQQQKSQQQLQQQHQHQQKNKYNSFDATSSILSDYDDLEVIDDDQSLYVLFNPKSLALSSRGNKRANIMIQIFFPLLILPTPMTSTNQTLKRGRR